MNLFTRELAFELSHQYCRCSEDCIEKATDLHHMLPNTKVNRRKFPLFIDSIFNLCPANNGCHLSKKMPSISEEEAEIYEKWLRDFRDSK